MIGLEDNFRLSNSCKLFMTTSFDEEVTLFFFLNFFFKFLKKLFKKLFKKKKNSLSSCRTPLRLMRRSHFLKKNIFLIILKIILKIIFKKKQFDSLSDTSSFDEEVTLFFFF